MTLILLVLLYIDLCCAQFTQLGVIAQWKEMEFAFPTAEHRHLAVMQGKYIRGNSVPIDMDLDYSGEFTGHSRSRKIKVQVQNARPVYTN